MLRKFTTSMAALFVAVAMINPGFATERAPKKKLSIAEAASQSQMRQSGPQQGNQQQALWDIQFNYNLSTSLPNGVLVGCVYTGTEFWVSKWNIDSLYTLSPSGTVTSAFKIPGVGGTGSGVRSFAYDGTNIYAADNTTSIKIIDPSTKTLSGTISSLAPISVRAIAYDSTANSGAGGFWVTDFASAFYLINMSGAVIDQITAMEHGLAGVYNIAFDPYTSGGPYLWAFDQGPNSTDAMIVQVSIPTKSVTGVIHDFNNDIAPGDAGIAGGLSITWRYDSTAYTIMGIVQSSGIMIGYELNDFVLPAVDAEMLSMTFSPPYTVIPEFEVSGYDWTLEVRNAGSDPLADLETSVYVTDGVTNVYAPASQHSTNVPSLTTVTTNFGLYSPTLGDYLVVGKANTGAQTDLINTNDSIVVPLSVSDTVMARDDGNIVGSLGIGGGTGGTLGQIFTLPNPAFVSSITMALNGPQNGDQTSVDIYNFTTMPTTIVCSTATYTFSGNDSAGVVLDLPIAGGPVSLPAGTYFVGVNEADSNITLATTPFNFHDNTGWVIFPPNAWAPLESFGAQFEVTFLLRMNLLDPATIDITEVNNERFLVYPNPASESINFTGEQSAFTLELFDLSGRLIHNSAVESRHHTVDVSTLPAGLYTARLVTGELSKTIRVTVTK